MFNILFRVSVVQLSAVCTKNAIDIFVNGRTEKVLVNGNVDDVTKKMQDKWMEFVKQSLVGDHVKQPEEVNISAPTRPLHSSPFPSCPYDPSLPSLPLLPVFAPFHFQPSPSHSPSCFSNHLTVHPSSPSDYKFSLFKSYLPITFTSLSPPPPPPTSPPHSPFRSPTLSSPKVLQK